MRLMLLSLLLKISIDELQHGTIYYFECEYDNLLPSVFYPFIDLLSSQLLFIPSSAFYSFIRFLSSHLSSHPPFIPHLSSSWVRSEYTPWLTDDIIKKIRNRDYLKKRAVKTGSLYMHQAYKRARNEVTINTLSTPKLNIFYIVLKQLQKIHKRCGKLLTSWLTKNQKLQLFPKLRLIIEVLPILRK